MRLSEAIRLGAMMTKPAYGIIGTNRRRCALGAAGFAIGYTAWWPRGIWHALEAEWPWLFDVSRTRFCPLCGDDRKFLAAILWHLNDTHRMSREWSADWVSLTIEPQEAGVSAILSR